ncbi:TetR/AcrR family transcriptional regulator [Parasphingorhabdus sp.]|uniref:TetR/AcrR family transcriptional regulator n=1 Tax=Parasphingorhabdus sp. TaxID=2709688 RepID=UPI0032ECA559
MPEKLSATPDWRTKTGIVRRQKTREKLLQSAARLIAQRGADALSIDLVISNAEVSRGTFYNYWSSQDSLVDDLWLEFGSNPFAEIQSRLAGVDDPARRLAMTACGALLRASIDPVWGWLVVALGLRDDLSEHELYSFPLPDIEAGVKTGRFQSNEPAVAGDFIVGAAISGLRAVLTGKVVGPVTTYAETLATQILMSLGLDQSEASSIASHSRD